MKEKYIESNRTTLVEYDTVGEFFQYMKDTPLNDTFSGTRRLASHDKEPSWSTFYKTKDWDEALDLLENGWDAGAKQLEQKLQAMKKDSYVSQRKCYNSVAGFQPNVALFMAGVPTNMINQRMVPKKQKVVKVTKAISYLGNVSASEIMRESAKAVQIVQKLEAMGYRVDLNVIRMNSADNGRTNYACKINIKKPSERLNIAKMAFALAHPSMLRRFMFGWTERYPKIPRQYNPGYGATSKTSEIAQVMEKGEILLPNFISADVEKIKSIEDVNWKNLSSL
jgi:hypothetical protein